MAKHPHVPPENRSPHEGEGQGARHEDADSSDVKELKNPEKHGQQANTKQNTTHQGYQQDR